MIDTFNADELERLSAARGGHLVSIYIPTVVAGDETQQNPIRLKNQIQRAEAVLEAQGLSTEEVNTLLAPARALVDDHAYWQVQSQGLAVFLGPEGMTTYRLPIPFDTQTVVAGYFAITPLLPLLTGDGHFYVLALSQNDVRLLQGTRYTVDEIDITHDIPDDLATMLRVEGVGETWRESRFRTADLISGPAGSAADTRESGNMSGHAVSYAVEEDTKQRILEFFQLVNDAVNELIHDQTPPLVLAGVEYLHPLYEKANSYDNLLEDGITGSPKPLSAEELHDAAWEIVAPIFTGEREKAAEDYQVLKSRERTENDLVEIVSAAYFERVEVLWLPQGRQVWGTFAPESGEVRINNGEHAPGSVDLLEEAARQTLANSGTVYVVPPDEMPDVGVAAAVLRY